MRARLRAINGADLRTTVLGVAQTYESWAQEIEGAHNRETCTRSQSGGGNGECAPVRSLGHRSARERSQAERYPGAARWCFVAAYDPEDARRIARLGRTYNKATYRREKGEALALWNERLKALVSGVPSNVVTMPKRGCLSRPSAGYGNGRGHPSLYRSTRLRAACSRPRSTAWCRRCVSSSP